MFDPAEVRGLLIEAARARQVFTYGALLAILGHTFTRPLMRQLCKVLDRIDEDGRAAGEPGLAVLVVRQSDGLPGQGWWLSKGHDPWDGLFTGPDAAAFVQRHQQRCFDHWETRE